MLTDGRTDGQTNGRKIGSLYRAMPEAGATIKTTDLVNIVVIMILKIFS